MGTRGILGLVADGKAIAIYNHYDSYPTGMGPRVTHFLDLYELRSAESSTVVVRQQILNLTEVDDSANPSAEQVEHLRAVGVAAPALVSTGSDWYAWLRDFQGNLAGYLGLGFWPDNIGFAADSLFCEWGYLVNLDTGKVEVYRGFQTDKSAVKGRFADLVPEQDHRRTPYYAISLLTEVDFATALNDASIWATIEESVYAEEDN